MDSRIAILFPVTDLARDGAQRQLFELVKGLDKTKFRPAVLTLNSGGAMEADFQKLAGVEVITVNKKGKYDLFCLFRVFSVLRKFKPLVIQPFLTPATFYGLLPALWNRTPAIIATERNASGRTDMGSGTRIYAWLEDLFSRFADWAIPNSAAGQESLVKRGINPQRIKVIYNGLNFQRLNVSESRVQEIRAQYGLPSHKQIIGMMARFCPIKNHAAFFKMAATVRRTLPETHFVLLGDGPLRQDMEDLAARSGLRDQTTFFGEHPDVGNYLAICDLVVLTSDAEGCSNSLLEAMSLGKPVIATNVGGNREVVIPGENGFLTPPGDIQTMSDQVIRLLQQKEEMQIMGQNARRFALANFSVEKMVHEYEVLYETTLSQKMRHKHQEWALYER